MRWNLQTKGKHNLFLKEMIPIFVRTKLFMRIVIASYRYYYYRAL